MILVWSRKAIQRVRAHEGIVGRRKSQWTTDFSRNSGTYIVYKSHVTCSNSSFSLTTVTPTSHFFAFHWLYCLLPIGYLPKPGSVVRSGSDHHVEKLSSDHGVEKLKLDHEIYWALGCCLHRMITKDFSELCLSPRVEEPKSEINKRVPYPWYGYPKYKVQIYIHRT